MKTKIFAYFLNDESSIEYVKNFAKKEGYNIRKELIKLQNYIVFYEADPKRTHFSRDKELLKELGIEILKITAIKSEFESDFKRMFRLNQVPSELSEEQKQKMSHENVLELWQV